MRLIAQGRDCDIFDLGDRTVLRRQRGGRSLVAEAVVMRHVSAHGFPCPAVHRTDGPDIVLDLLDGPTMTQDVFSETTVDRARVSGVLLAELHDQLHRIPPLAAADEGSVLHLDLHPENVVMTAGGPVVVDWTNAISGPPEVDLAMTWVILEPYAQSIPLVRELLDAFLDTAGRQAARTGLTTAAERRRADGNVTDAEGAAIRALLDREHAT